MAFLQTDLADELEALFNSLQTPGFDASTAWGVAFATYFKAATLGPTLVIPAAVDLAAIEMSNAITFSNSAGAAANAGEIAEGLTAFWAEIVSAPATFWGPALAPVVVPAAIVGGAASTVSSLILSAFAANQAPGITRAQAAAALALAIHPSNLGGTAVVVTTPTPIL